MRIFVASILGTFWLAWSAITFHPNWTETAERISIGLLVAFVVATVWALAPLLKKPS